MRKEFVEVVEEMVNGKLKVVEKKVRPPPLRKEANSNKRDPTSSPERASSSFKARRTVSPMSFNDSYDFMDTMDTMLDVPSSPVKDNKGGKVRFCENVCIPNILIIPSQSQNDMMRDWLPYRDEFLHQILSVEGCGTHGLCGSCGKLDGGEYRCSDCYYSGLLCQECCLKDHTRHPFHSIGRWNGKYFQSTTLRDLGFVLHLGHGGSSCPENGGVDVKDFTVVDLDRVHNHQVAWCGCANAPERWKQLLQVKLYPASVQLPRTAFTFRLLEYYSMDVLECNSTAFAFMTKLRRLTNLYHPETVPVSGI
jgi:hypothetical protein